MTSGRYESGLSSPINTRRNHQKSQSSIDLSYHNENSLIVLDKDHQPPFIDLEGGKDLASKK